jgi:hypothetical protein
MAGSSDTLKTILLVGAIGVGGYFIYQRFFKERQGMPAAQPRTAAQPVTVAQPATQQPSGLSVLAEILRAAPPQQLQIYAPSPQRAQQIYEEVYTPWQEQIALVQQFFHQYPQAQIRVFTTPAEWESQAQIPPPPPGMYFSPVEGGLIGYFPVPPALIVT